MISVMCPKCRLEYLASDEAEARRIGLLHVQNVHPPEVPA